jgi:2-oxoglutarate dehydrogenase E1 component
MPAEARPSTAPLPDPGSVAFLETLYEAFRRDPSRVQEGWRAYFERLRLEDADGRRPGPAPGGEGPAAPDDARVQAGVARLVQAYRDRGHLAARLDPLGAEPPGHPELDPAAHGLAPSDLDRACPSPWSATATLTVREILDRLARAYCGPIGIETAHVDDAGRRAWLHDAVEHGSDPGRAPAAADGQERQVEVLRRLTEATVWEEFIQQKYVGATSFSLEGAESLIPLLDAVVERAGAHGVDEVVLAMAHRGRLNVLANVVGKPPRDIFREFEDRDGGAEGARGDVKYHLGHSTDRVTAGGRRVHLSLCFNPSHLEFVDPVAVGRMRAKQDRVGDAARARGLVVLIHGEAAFAGEGVIQETLNLSELPGYTTGGTLHVVVDNQLGFTTAPAEGRSTTYATAVAKMLPVPILHVNGEDLGAVGRAVRLALDFRARFRSDAVVDLRVFRRRGHNEGDDPSFTQPLLYRRIADHPSARDRYLERLVAAGVLERAGAERFAGEYRARLDAELEAARREPAPPAPGPPQGVWEGYRGGPADRAEAVRTGLPRARLAGLLEASVAIPPGFHLHPRLARWREGRRAMARGERALDWAAAEAVALAALACEGHRVRLSGQDTARGTFSQRHAALVDVETGATHVPLASVEPGQAPLEVLNSPLSEIATLGFEYGYSLDCPGGLVLWEAQFGDFVNAAQVIVDQFLVSAEEKWQRLSGLVLLLPHAFEGQGPEHSSARLERFLELAVDDNIQVVYPTTPAQYFHVLRRQGLSRWRKPLVVLTPKSLLRHPAAVSPLSALEAGRFEPILGDPTVDPGGVRRILLASGKVVYDLLAGREATGRPDVAVLRLEQLYPLADEDVARALAGYPPGAPVVWVQEEPANMGAWCHLASRFGDRLPGGRSLTRVARSESASPATGSAARHRREQAALVQEALDG